MFGNLQVITANQLLGIALAATGSIFPFFSAILGWLGVFLTGVMGKMIALPSIAVAVAATGLTSEDEGKLFRFTLTHSIFLACVVGIVAMLFAYVFPSLVPVLPSK